MTLPRYEKEYPYPTEASSGTTDGWTVEARYVNYQAKEVCGQIFDDRWQRVRFVRGPIGVPNGNCLDRYAGVLGFYPYESAQALRWWFLAEMETDPLGSLCMETRLVRHEVVYSLRSTAISAHDNLGGDEAQFSSNRPIDMQGIGRKLKTKTDEVVG